MPLSHTSATAAGITRRTRQERDLRPDVPDHEILRLIGTGAYGEVWLARSVTGIYRAVKVVWREDFKDDATYISELESIREYEPKAHKIPGVVHVMHVGQNSGEFPYYYYVMELADDAYTGIHIDPAAYMPRTLQSDMDLYGRNPMPLEYVLEVGSQLAHALDGLRAENLIHRDVKPSNIVFVNGRAKLADAGSVVQSEKKSFAGTHGYAPPEGANAPRADVYALGIVLYEMSTGHDRLNFPELPEKMPDDVATHRKWLEFNEIICSAASPQIIEGSIVTAQEMAKRLDSLRQYAPGNRSGRRPEAKRPTLLYWLGAFVLMALLGVLGYYLAPQELRYRLRGAYNALRGADRTPEPKHTQIFINSVPSGASIYTESGRYVDETPYGPVEVEPGREVSFILRKEGYADAELKGVAPAHGLLPLGVDMQPYRPPKQFLEWQDALGNPYKPSGTAHQALAPVSMQQFELFLRSSPSAGEIDYERVPGKDYVRTNLAGINAYTLWLTRLCERGGFLGPDHTLAAVPEPDTFDDKGKCAYRLVTRPVQKTPISLHSTPSGASVWLNGRPLGVTPLQGVRVPLAPYLLEIRMPGFATQRITGISPKDLSLNVTLEPNNSVSFGAKWSNSLGLEFCPFTPTLMAGATEVRVSDYHAYVAATGATMPPPTDFVQSGDHPVVCVSRLEAERFARWLTDQERRAGLIGPTDRYRLPTDEEWSTMVGIKDEKGRSPYERRQSRSKFAVQEFPWGITWPPPARAGNFADDSARPYVSSQYVLEHYSDGYPFSAPVGTFAPNSLGLYDLSGNVQEWVSDKYGGPENFPFKDDAVTRGGDYTSFRPGQLASDSRTPRPPDDRNPTVGFRLMLERAEKKL